MVLTVLSIGSMIVYIDDSCGIFSGKGLVMLMITTKMSLNEQFNTKPHPIFVYFIAKPDAPALTIPSAIVEGLTTSHPFICEANVGYPDGDLYLQMRLPNETDFYPVPFNVSTEIEDLNCSSFVRKSFRFEPGLKHNGMELRCEVSNPATLPTGFNLVAAQIIHVVPGISYIFYVSFPFNFLLNYDRRVPL